MKKNTILSKKIIREINRSINDLDHKLDVDFLRRENYFNYEIEEWYGEEFGIKGELRKRIIKTLIRTFYEWKQELEQLDQDYYLAIWLCIPRMLKSEVVCAVGDKISYYKNEAFLTSEKKSTFNFEQFGNLSDELENFDWQRKVDMEAIYEWEINYPMKQYESEKEYYKDQRFFKKLIREQFHVVERENERIFFHPKGDVWIGTMN